VAAALVFALRTSHPAAQEVMVAAIAAMVSAQPSLFEPHTFAFYVKSFDAYNVRVFKLQILTTLLTEANSHAVLQELQVRETHPPEHLSVSTYMMSPSTNLPSHIYQCQVT
jgi:AP-3 complex subunit beta